MAHIEPVHEETLLGEFVKTEQEEIKVSLTKDEVQVLLYCILKSLYHVRKNPFAHAHTSTVSLKLDKAIKQFEK